jgi:hypothetical protein
MKHSICLHEMIIKQRVKIQKNIDECIVYFEYGSEYYVSFKSYYRCS